MSNHVLILAHINYNIVNFDFLNLVLVLSFCIYTFDYFHFCLIYWFVLLSVKMCFFTVTDLLKNSQTAKCKYF